MTKPSVNTDIVVAGNTAVVLANTPAQDRLADYLFTRENLYKLMKQGMAAVELMMNITDQSQHPRSAEVLAQMLKNVGELNDKLMDLQGKISKLEQEGQNTGRPQTVSIGNIDKAVFTGSTTDLLDSIKKNREG